MDEYSHVQSVNALLENKPGGEGQELLAQARAQYSIRKQGLLQQLSSSRRGANFTMQWMEVICDFSEKVRNLVLWEDPNMTSLFFALEVVVFIVVTFLPLRFIIFVAFIYKFICGQRW